MRSDSRQASTENPQCARNCGIAAQKLISHSLSCHVRLTALDDSSPARTATGFSFSGSGGEAASGGWLPLDPENATGNHDWAQEVRLEDDRLHQQKISHQF
jgi:hypothetical protein